MCTTGRGCYRVQDRALRPELIFHLPNRPSLPHHHPDIRRLGCFYSSPRRSTVSARSLVPKSAQGIQFLHLVFHPPRARDECDQDCASRQFIPPSSDVAFGRQSSPHCCTLSPLEKDTLGKRLSRFHQHGRDRHHIFDHRPYHSRRGSNWILDSIHQLPLQSPLRLFIRARYAGPPLPACVGPAADRRLPRRDLSRRSLRTERRIWTSGPYLWSHYILLPDQHLS